MKHANAISEAHRNSNRGQWLRWSFVFLALILFAVLAKITFGVSRKFYPPQSDPAIVIGELTTDQYEQGYPWAFHSWWEDTWTKTSHDKKWRPWAFAADTLCFLVGTMGIVLATRHFFYRPRISIAAFAIVVAICAAGCAWIGNAYRRSAADADLANNLASIEVYVYATYTDPVWLSRLTGETGSFNGLFYRLSGSQSLEPPPFERERFLKLMGKHPGLIKLRLKDGWKNEDVSRLLQMPSARSLRSLDVMETHLSDDALKGIENCQDLRRIDITRSDIGDNGIERLVRCRRLEVLRAVQAPITEKSLPALLAIADRTAIDVSRTAIAQHGGRFRSPGAKNIEWDE